MSQSVKSAATEVTIPPGVQREVNIYIFQNFVDCLIMTVSSTSYKYKNSQYSLINKSLLNVLK